jgi:hypothetical protein
LQINYWPSIAHRRVRGIRVVEERLTERIDLERRNHRIILPFRHRMREIGRIANAQSWTCAIIGCPPNTA